MHRRDRRHSDTWSTAWNAKKDFDRFTVLFEQKSASQKELDDVRTHYQMAKAQLEAVRQMEVEVNESLQYSSIKNV